MGTRERTDAANGMGWGLVDVESNRLTEWGFCFGIGTIVHSNTSKDRMAKPYRELAGEFDQMNGWCRRQEVSKNDGNE